MSTQDQLLMHQLQMAATDLLGAVNDLLHGELTEERRRRLAADIERLVAEDAPRLVALLRGETFVDGVVVSVDDQ